MLVDAGLMKTADDSIVFFNFHERFQINISDAGGLFLQGQQQGEILFPVPASADFPEVFPDGLNIVQLSVIIAESAGKVAAVGFPDGGKPGAQKAAPAAAGKTYFRSDKQCACRSIRRPGKCVFRSGHHCFQAGDGQQGFFPACFHGCFCCGVHCVFAIFDLLPQYFSRVLVREPADLPLPAAERFIRRQFCKETEPGQRVFSGNFHGCFILSECYRIIAVSLTK